jgi:hypothetical protein
MTELEWHAQNLAVKRAAEQAEIARYVEWREREERRLRTKFSAQKAAALKAAPPPPAMSGMGWKVIANPRLSSHEELEAHARSIWATTWHGIDWPASWRVRWGELDALVLAVATALGQCALRGGLTRTIVLGLCVMNERIILLDETNNRARSAQERDQTLIHELVHANLRDEVHGPKFQSTLRNAATYYAAVSGLQAPAVANASAPPPWWGPRFGPGRVPGLEYRGSMPRQGD